MLSWAYNRGASPTLMAFAAHLAGSDRAQGNIGGLFIGILVAAIIGVAVVIPVVNDVIDDSNITGTELTVIELIPLFVALLLLIALAGPLMRRVG